MSFQLQQQLNGSLMTPYPLEILYYNNGNVGIGTSSPSQLLEISGENIADFNRGLLATHYSNDHLAITLSLRKARGTTNAPSAILKNDLLGSIKLTGFSTNDWSTGTRARIDGGAAENWNDNAQGTFIRFQTTKLGTTTAVETLRITSEGNVGIGTADPKSKLAVNGQIRATEVKVSANISVPDYVFAPDYELKTLQETKEYISNHHHLPEIPSAKDIEANGINIGEMNMLLLKKIEELTLHLIEMKAQNTQLENRINKIENR
ncbi:hypothetical protein N7E81_04785 [Reichenbachiella carrageenanivorans]|uniref:Chaperone of endosialidase n=1 Tax=Reichenbachiella carrageenanivorans TaxID=2979869 RepID=A0ABY6D2M9_9BACT|nr:hypothetical protein [Reichenbachiella carrageenanivorans]UXX80414.1 hypothetical protein N7E81_04785 [Reichenbachiella carrageenanivorans]